MSTKDDIQTYENHVNNLNAILKEMKVIHHSNRRGFAECLKYIERYKLDPKRLHFIGDRYRVVHHEVR
jgi:hypothetical protein